MNPKNGCGTLRLKQLGDIKKLTDLKQLGMNASALSRGFRHYFNHTLGREGHCDNAHYYYTALAMTVRDRLMERWKDTLLTYEEANCERAYYLSLEFLMGRTLSNALLNLNLAEDARKALLDLGIYLEEIAEAEHDAGLGNGGLGRLAACFLDSCATLQLPVKGYGIRYEYGMFRQKIEGGHQKEEPDHWLRDGHPWELERPEYTCKVRFGGWSRHQIDEQGRHKVFWEGTSDVQAVPFDVPIPGYKNGTVNTLRLWKAIATDEFSLEDFNKGSYTDAVQAKFAAEHITMVLYPNDSSENGKVLRLKQQYFLASASVQDVLREWNKRHKTDFTDFARRNRFQLNDTHPTIAVAELMRLLLDEQGQEWEQAWEITRNCLAYTNHTLLPEALEKWPVAMFEYLLPRPLEIIYEINARFLAEVATRWPGDIERQRRMSIIEEEGRMVRMAHLAIVGCFSVNGVAELHSELLKQGLFHDFYELWPERFNNKTNGVTQRRWLAGCNPGLRDLIGKALKEEHWICHLDKLQGLRPHAEDPAFRRQWHAVKQANKQRLAALVKKDCGIELDVTAMFDVQVKRIHEYKRQLLNLLHVIHLYNRIKAGDTENWTPRCVIIGGKAAPGYHKAKLIIKLVNNIAAKVNADPAVGDLLKLVFLPNYRVSAMEVICPGTDLSEQISTAGKEASGTGNMKFMMNGALTIGTLDGANIEIREEVGDDHFFLFGLTAEEVASRRGHYDPNAIIAADPALAKVMSLLECGHFNQFEPGLFDEVIRAIRSPSDPWMVAADFADYVAAQERAAAAYRDRDNWVRSSILNTASSGKFSTDRTIREYNEEIWKLRDVKPKGIAC
jgi:glycogen phosphorylase